MKNMQFGPYSKIPSSYTKLASKNTMVTSDFLTESRNIGISRMRNETYAIWPIFMAESPKIAASYRKSGSANTMVTSNFLTGSRNIGVSRMRYE